GAGDGAGAGIARAFAKEGYAVCITRRPRNLTQLELQAQSIRDGGGKAYAYGVDARDEGQTAELIEKIETEIGPLEVAVFNIGANVRFSGIETTGRVFRKVWEMACFSGFLMARECAKAMIPRGRGTILFTGATASIRGGPNQAAFASAKHGLRAVSRSFARELGPQGIHVAHVVMDGPIKGKFASERVSHYDARLARDEVLLPDDIGRFYVELHNQPRSAWVYQADLRPWTEKWDW
ncbi:MAG TPA: SDR family oxidoreductase, partial [Terriglobales bacterium]